MHSMRVILLTVSLFFGIIASAGAHVETLTIHVISFTPEKQPDRYTIVFDAVTSDYGDDYNLPARKRRFEVHLRCEPRFGPREEFRESVRILRSRLSHGPALLVGRMSGRGWRPIPGQKNVFESVGLATHRAPDIPSEDHTLVYFVHDDRY
jgi:hypothetical protein